MLYQVPMLYHVSIKFRGSLVEEIIGVEGYNASEAIETAKAHYARAIIPMLTDDGEVKNVHVSKLAAACYSAKGCV